MSRPSYDYILNQLRECQRENGALSTDESYNVLTMKALPFRLRREAESARYVVVVRIENFNKALQEWGHDWLIGAIRRAVNVRAPQVLIRSRWTADNEIVFILSGDPEEFCQRLGTAIRNEGLNSSLAYVQYSGNVAYDHDRAAEAFQTVTIRS